MTGEFELSPCRRQIKQMSEQKAWKCSACGVEVADLPMTVLRHQLSHAERRGLAVDRLEPDAPSAEDQHQKP
jgi:ribosomal protein L37AE/L43A